MTWRGWPWVTPMSRFSHCSEESDPGRGAIDHDDGPSLRASCIDQDSVIAEIGESQSLIGREITSRQLSSIESRVTPVVTFVPPVASEFVGQTIGRPTLEYRHRTFSDESSEVSHSGEQGDVTVDRGLGAIRVRVIPGSHLAAQALSL
jgi:hypothetical protein